MSRGTPGTRCASPASRGPRVDDHGVSAPIDRLHAAIRAKAVEPLVKCERRVDAAESNAHAIALLWLPPRSVVRGMAKMLPRSWLLSCGTNLAMCCGSVTAACLICRCAGETCALVPVTLLFVSLSAIPSSIGPVCKAVDQRNDGSNDSTTGHRHRPGPTTRTSRSRRTEHSQCA